jgi:hypothetical protein
MHGPRLSGARSNNQESFLKTALDVISRRAFKSSIKQLLLGHGSVGVLFSQYAPADFQHLFMEDPGAV